MKIVHWIESMGTGMNSVVDDICAAEKKLGHDSIMVPPFNRDKWKEAEGADIHVSDSIIPGEILLSGAKNVFVGHGTPEWAIEAALEDGKGHVYGHSDSFMLTQHSMQNADAIIAFWPRHAEIYASWSDKNTVVHYVPLGVDKEFWKPTPSRGKYAGSPSLLECEAKGYEIKRPLDLFLMWAWVYKEVPGACMHMIACPQDQHRIWFPIGNRNGACYGSHITSGVFQKDYLRNIFCSVDYVANFVRYGDFNRVTLEAKACGAKVISWCGNEYADFWINEGDQRDQAKQMVKIFKGEIEPRKITEVIDVIETAKIMISIYQEVING